MVILRPIFYLKFSLIGMGKVENPEILSKKESPDVQNPWFTLRQGIRGLSPQSITPKSCHHHVIRPLNYIFALNPSTWTGDPCCLSIFHENTQHRAFSVNHERYLARTACILFSISGAIACGLCSISVSYLNRSVIREEKRYPG